MRYLSVCSGIEAASQAWHPLGWKPVAFSEIEKFPCKVLAHQYPSVPNYGDMTNFKEWPDANTIDLLVGGTPCQSFSVAGLRKGLDDPRGSLMLTYLAIADKYRPKWIVWENVPGVLSSNGGKDFGTFLGALEELGYGFAYRVLDAQFCRTDGYPYAVPQRRRRVFVVGYLGDWGRAAAVLFDSESLRGNPPPRREAGKNATNSVAFGVAERSEVGHCLRSGASKADKHESTTYIAEQVAGTIGARTGVSIGAQDAMNGHMLPVAPTLDAHYGDKMGLDNQHINAVGGCSSVSKTLITKTRLDAGTETPIPTIGGGFDVIDTVLNTPWNHLFGPIGFNAEARPDEMKASDTSAALTRSQHSAVALPTQVRRLTPTECARLQGFPDDYLPQVPGYSDSAAYKALGNSMAVNVMQLIGRRIQMVEK